MTRDSVSMLSPLEREERYRLIEPLRFLFELYKPKYWYWELVDTIQRLTLTGLLAVINPGSSEQVLFAIVISLICVRIYLSYTPYVDVQIISCKEIVLWQLFFIYSLIYVMRQGFFEDQSELLTASVLLTATANIIFELLNACFVVCGRSIRSNKIQEKLELLAANLTRIERIEWHKAQLEKDLREADATETLSTNNILNQYDESGNNTCEVDEIGDGNNYRTTSNVQMSSYIGTNTN